MTIESDLLDAIRRSPDDDAPRHVYADHLQRRGDPRGEFIALDCEVLRQRFANAGVVAPELEQRCDALLAEHRVAWGAPLFALGGAPNTETRAHLRSTYFNYRRGFVTCVVFVRNDLADLGALLRLEPVFDLELSWLRPGTGDEEAPAELAWLRSLWIHGESDLAAAILASPHLSRLERLRCRRFPVALARALARGAARPTTVELSGTGYEMLHVGDEALAALGGTDAFANVSTLEIDQVSFAALAAIPMPKLRELVMKTPLSQGANGIDARSLAPMRALFAQLVRLVLPVERAHEAGVRRFLAETLSRRCRTQLDVYELDTTPDSPW